MAAQDERGGVVAGFDGSDQAREAVWWAAAEAATRRCPLLVLQAEPLPVATVAHGWGPVTAPSWGTPMVTAWDPAVLLSDERVRQHTEERLSALGEELRAGVPGITVATSYQDGRPATALAETAADRDAALLVLGATGLGALPRMLLGSTAAELVHETDRPVIVVRHAAATEQAPAPPADAPVVVGVDGTGASDAAVEFAFDFAARHRCPLHAVHARSDRPLDVLAAAGVWDRAPDQEPVTDDVTDRLLGGRRHPDVPVRTDIVGDRPARALVERSERARLLVVGDRGHGRVHRALLGSVSHAAMYHAPCPVAVVTPR
ncbi:universal stress protein [Actinophytocola gossypii]|uniref:Universal stress protein n=1 Tax=Actinophytocola gossypii TaxID=2812003 RepID=A0ABT2J289_9PSEU|nr:universal stress protein [Actinophytocola gossypii]MCT2581881.1 universal stress protein [Actinophytocola gossypii]